MAIIDETGSPPPYWRVQGLVRGLDVLWALKMQPAATASVHEISEQTRLHRTTVKRLLETLRYAGYVEYVHAAGTYRLTFRVRELSEGLRDDSAIVNVAAPFIRELTGKALWPSDLLVLDGDQMAVRDATHHRTSLSFARNVLGAHVPLLGSMAGRAYMAFCPAPERAVLLDMLRARTDAEGARARDTRAVNAMIKAARQSGYVAGDMQKFRLLAVPIRSGRGGRSVAACLNIVFLAKAVTTAHMLDHFLPQLVATQRKIEAAFARVRRKLPG